MCGLEYFLGDACSGHDELGWRCCDEVTREYETLRP